MNDLYFSVPSIVASLIGYYGAWRLYTKGNYAAALALLMLCGLILRVYTSADFFLHAWDERYHALVAKNLLQHPLTPTLYNNPVLPFDYTNWSANHIWVHKQPLPLWTIAGSMYLFGVNEIALRLPSILFTTLGIGLSYYMASYFVDKRAGLFTAFLYSINGLIIELAAGRVATDHVDIFFLFFVQLAVVFSILFVQQQRAYFNLFVGLSLGAAILSKWLPALIVLPVWFLLLVDSGKFKPVQIATQLGLVLLTAIAVALPWQIYINTAFPVEAAWEASFNLKHITEVLDEQTGPPYYFLNQIRINYGELMYLPLGWYIWMAIQRPINLKRWAIIIWALVPLLFFSIAKTKMQAYILFTAPALFLMTAEFFFMLLDRPKPARFKWFYTLILVLLVALPIRYMIERVKPFNMTNRHPEWVQNLRELNQRPIKNGLLFNFDKPIEAMFYTKFTAYPQLPEPALLTDLMQKGYTIIIHDDGKIPAGLKTMPGLTFVRL